MTRDIKKLNILNTLPNLACWNPVRLLCSVMRIHHTFEQRAEHIGQTKKEAESEVDFLQIVHPCLLPVV